MAQIWLLISVLTLTVLQLFISGVLSTTFTIVNKCDYTVWPGILSNAGIAPLSTTGFSLQTGESKTINPPSSWGGRLWGRTLCTEDSTGKFTCVTGDCGSGKLECAGGNAAPPATLAEFTLDGSGGLDFYDVSLVDGYNLPILVVPQGGTGANCTTTGCEVDLNGACPSELKVTSSDGESVACKSACEAFGQAQYCCSGAYGTPDTCKPSLYSDLFKSACPSAYSYAYDDKTSKFTCAGADYLITFCPSPNSSWSLEKRVELLLSSHISLSLSLVFHRRSISAFSSPIDLCFLIATLCVASLRISLSRASQDRLCSADRSPLSHRNSVRSFTSNLTLSCFARSNSAQGSSTKCMELKLELELEFVKVELDVIHEDEVRYLRNVLILFRGFVLNEV